MINISIKHLKKLQTPSGLFKASSTTSKTGYDRIWIRDNLYISLAFESIKDIKTLKQIYHGLLNIFLKYEYKIDCAIKEKPTKDYEYIHPLYTLDLEEIKTGWGWKQNDSIGLSLFKIGQLERKYNIIRNENDFKIIKKLIKYLESIKYWEDKDNGIWEEDKELHASSVGACIAGLKEISKLTTVPKELISKGELSLRSILPKESNSKDIDLALLSLIYPYNIINIKTKKEILHNMEKYLVRKNGIIRYQNDKYYNKNNTEASWCMGFPWIAICYKSMNNVEKYKEYLSKTINCLDSDIKLPELYIEDTTPNKNTPLGWGQSLFIYALNY